MIPTGYLEVKRGRGKQRVAYISILHIEITDKLVKNNKIEEVVENHDRSKYEGARHVLFRSSRCKLY